MEVKYTPNFLYKLEEVFLETHYILRYEKGNFKAGYCVLKEDKIVVINKYFPLEGKINALIDILKTLEIDTESLTEKNRKFYNDYIAHVI